MNLIGCQKLNEVLDKILHGKIKKNEVIIKLNQLEKDYDLQYLIANVERKEKPWNMKYLKEYYNQISYKQGSKQCILYFAEVADEVYARKRKKQKTIGMIIGIIAILSTIITILVFLNKR